MIGPYPCIIPEKGVNEIFLTCETSPAIYPELRSALPVIVYVSGKPQSICGTTSCKYTYSDTATPYLDTLSPFAAIPGTYIKWLGFWRLSNTEDIKKMIIGDKTLCNRLRIDQPILNLNDKSPISSTDWIFIDCQTASDQTAGIY